MSHPYRNKPAKPAARPARKPARSGMTGPGTPGTADIQLVRNALGNYVRVIGGTPTKADRANQLATLALHLGKVDVWLAAQPHRTDLILLKQQLEEALHTLRTSDDANFAESEALGEAPLLHIDLYEARLFIQGHRQRILANAFAAAKRIASQRGVTALRYEAYQREALRQGFISAYLQVNPVPTGRGKEAAARYRQELLGVARRAEGELMAMLGSLKGMILRLGRTLVTKGLFEGEGEGEGDGYMRRLPQYNRTAIHHRAQTSKQAFTQQRSALRLAARPSQQTIRTLTARFPAFPPGLGNQSSVINRVRAVLWVRWFEVARLAGEIGSTLAKSTSGDPGPALFGHFATELLVRRAVIDRSAKPLWADFFGKLWSAPIFPKPFLVAAVAALALLGESTRGDRHASFENLPMVSQEPVRSPSLATAEAEALAAFELAAS